MTFEEEIERFFRGFVTEEYDRKAIESDAFYQKAVKERNAIAATNRALELIPGYGNVKNKRQQRSLLKKRKRGDFMEFI